MKQLIRSIVRSVAGFGFFSLSVCWGCTQVAQPIAPAVPLEPDPIYRFAGEVKLPDGKHWDFLVLLVQDPSQAGEYLGTVDIPLQALHGESLHNVRFEPGRLLEFSLALPGEPTIRASLVEAQPAHCQFAQNGQSRPCDIAPVAPEPFEPLGAAGAD